MHSSFPEPIRRQLLLLRAQMLAHMRRSEADTVCCPRCFLPYPEGEFESYTFCPWCLYSVHGCEARSDESRKIILAERYGHDEIQCGECGGEYEQPTRYPFKFCPHCGAPFAAHDEILIELPFLV